MNITQLRYVLAVAQYENFSRAAESLFLTQPALSLQILQLERELGFPLFHRTPKGVILTEDGEAFCHEGKPILEAWSQLKTHMEERKSHPTGRLCIGLGPRFYANGLFEPLVRFFDERPELSVTFVSDMSDDVLRDLREKRVDLALDRLPPTNLIPEAERYVSHELVRERQCILLSPNDPRSRRKNLSFRELQGSTVVTGSEGSMEERIILQDCQDYGITLTGSYRSDSIYTIMRLVRSGKGLVIGPESFADYFQVAAVPMLPEVYISLSFICLREMREDPRLELIRKFLQETCAERWPEWNQKRETEG